MSQDASPTSTRPTPTQSLPPAWATGSSGFVKTGGFSVESYADRLMDELFEDVEQSLAQGTSQLAKPEAAPVQPVPPLLPPSESPLVIQPIPQPLSLENDSIQENDSTEISDLELEPSLLAETRRPNRSYDRFLLSFGCLALVAAGVLWLVLRTKQPEPIAATPQPVPSPVNPSDNQQFAEYLKQSLQALAERSPTAIASNKSGTSNPPTSGLPNVPIAKTPSLPNRTAITGLGQLSNPTYQLAPNLLPKAPVAPSVPAPTAMQSPPPATPTVTKTLVGVMELGDRSAALVEIAGVVQRFRIGESISASGWTLVEISKNQAVIRRNGEVRSIFIGQAF